MPDRSGHYMTLSRSPRRSPAADQHFLRDATDNGRFMAARQVPGRSALAHLILFYEYFHGDNGAGWSQPPDGMTGLAAFVLDIFGRLDAMTLLETERGECSPSSSRSRSAEKRPARSEEGTCLIRAILRCTKSTRCG